MAQNNTSGFAKTAAKGTAWLYVVFYIGKLILFLSTVILARLLAADDFGVVGYAVTIIGFLEVFRELGISAAQIYYQDKENVLDTAFWLNITISTILCILVWISAPVIGEFFHDPRAIWTSRILILNFPLSALYGTHETLIVQNLDFRKKFIPGFAQALGRGFISISLAFLGFGHWSLVIGQVTGNILAAIFFWRLVDWRPSFFISLSVASDLLKFGLPMIGATIADMLVLNVDYLIIGRYLGAEALGIYTLAFRIPELVIQTFCSIVATVIFPVFVKIREDPYSLRKGFLRVTRYISLVTVPMGLGLVFLADSFVYTLFTEKWIAAIPIMRAISIVALVHSFGYSAGDIYKAQGKPGILTRVAIFKLFFLVPGLYWAVVVPSSLIAVGWVQIVVSIIGTLTYLAVAIRILNLRISNLWTEFSPSLIGGGFLALALLAFLHYFSNANDWYKLIGGILVGGMAYFLGLWIFAKQVLLEGIDLVRAIIQKEK